METYIEDDIADHLLAFLVDGSDKVSVDGLRYRVRIPNLKPHRTHVIPGIERYAISTSNTEAHALTTPASSSHIA